VEALLVISNFTKTIDRYDLKTFESGVVVDVLA
jgi:hypothetical protein